MFGDLKTFDDVKNRYRKNWQGFIDKYFIWLSLVLITGVADTVSTIHFMSQSGAEHEAHPAIRLVSILFGPFLGPIIGKLCQFVAILAITVFFRKQAIFVFIPVIILYAWAAWYNIWGNQIYYPRLLQLIEFLS